MCKKNIADTHFPTDDGFFAFVPANSGNGTGIAAAAKSGRPPPTVNTASVRTYATGNIRRWQRRYS
jgi:hypothetical protein